jgi:uncharacterized protein YndB with AHSA1/START domain
MTATTHRYETFIAAPREEVWQALIDPEFTVRYFHATRIESSFRPGSPYRYVIDSTDAEAVDGVIELCDPPHRLTMTWHALYDAEMADEPVSRVEWTLTPANDDGTVTRVTLRHGDLALSPKTWAGARLGWVQVIDGLKTLLETGRAMPAVDVEDSPTEPTDIEGNWHRAQAVTANSETWELLAEGNRSADDADDLLQRAYAAAYHWRRATGATAVNAARAAWLVSRSHVVLGHGDLALHHAVRCAELTDAAGADAADFDRGYAHEARARALACLGRHDEAEAEYRSALASEVADDDDRSIFRSDLSAEPWFGLDGTAATGVGATA